MHLVTGQYAVVQDDEDDTYTHKVYEPNGKDYIGPNMTEAQAEIIAWALNRIAEGRVLIAVNPQDNVRTTYPYEIYAGAEEGIQ